mmetsp:Transcript_20194/g.37752  ORF Transcript_20194/g.37752 Transcript_20194/m.37752 type:complete len:169 (+) Transcript_20194:159-665(+)
MYAFAHTQREYATRNNLGRALLANDVNERILETLFEDDRSQCIYPPSEYVIDESREATSPVRFAEKSCWNSTNTKGTVGIARRGWRLRQRFQLSLDLSTFGPEENENDLPEIPVVVTTSTPSDDITLQDAKNENDAPKSRIESTEYLQALQRTPGSNGITISKPPGQA